MCKKAKTYRKTKRARKLNVQLNSTRVQLRIALVLLIFCSVPTNALPHLEEVAGVHLLLDNGQTRCVSIAPESLYVVRSEKRVKLSDVTKS